MKKTYHKPLTTAIDIELQQMVVDSVTLNFDNTPINEVGVKEELEGFEWFFE